MIFRQNSQFLKNKIQRNIGSQRTPISNNLIGNIKYITQVSNSFLLKENISF